MLLTSKNLVLPVRLVSCGPPVGLSSSVKNSVNDALHGASARFPVCCSAAGCLRVREDPQGDADLEWQPRPGAGGQSQWRRAGKRCDVVYASLRPRCRSTTTPAARVEGGQPAAAHRDHDFPAWQGRDLAARDPAARLYLLTSDCATATTVAHQQLLRLRRLGVVPPWRR
jgi:hypothetical protein